MNQAFSKGQVKKSLAHFIVGKTASVILGIAVLLLLVRVLSREDYGVYVVLLALFEVLQVGSNLGAFSCAHRFVPELIRSGNGLGLQRCVRLLVGYRLLTLIGAACILVLLAGPASTALSIPNYTKVISLYALVIISEGGARFIDLVLESALQQGRAQISIIVRNLPRCLVLLGLVFWPNTFGDFSLLTWIAIEAICSGTGFLLSFLLLIRFANDFARDYPADNFKLFSSRVLKYSGLGYLSQLLYSLLSADTARVVFAKFAGIAAVGAFGFAGAIVSMIRRYSPVFLLIGMLRPIFVASYSSEGGGEKLGKFSDLILRLNLFFLFPLLAITFVVGPELATLISGGKFPEAHWFLQFFLLLLLLQTWRSVLELVANAFEDGSSPIIASLCSLIVMGASIGLAAIVGANAICAGLLLSEAAWCIAVTRLVAKKGFLPRHDYASLARMLLLVILSGTVGEVVWFAFDRTAVSETVALLATVLVIGAAYLSMGLILKVFNETDRSFINSVLPKKVFIW